MMKRIAKYLIGTRGTGEVGYYKRVRHVERRLKEIALTIALVIGIAVAMLLCIYMNTDTTTGHYEPDAVVDGQLIDTDGDGNFYHWVED